MAARIVILGGGFGGLTAATELEPLTHSGKAEVTLVERSTRFAMGFSMQWALAGRRRPEDGERAYSTLRARGARWVHDDVVAVDPERRVVVTKSSALPYDRLIVALGADVRPDLLGGLTEAAYNLCDTASVLRLKAALETIERGTVLILVSAVPFKCPPSPYEYAFLADDLLRKRGVRDSVRVVLATPEPQPMPVAGPVVGDAVKTMLAERGIEASFGREPAAVDPRGRTVQFKDGSSESYNVLAAMPPHRAPGCLGDLVDASGFVPAELGTFRTAARDVAALGDCAALKLPNGKPHPKAGVFAEAQALAVARAVAAELGSGKEEPYSGKGVCYVDTGKEEAAPAEADLLALEGPKFVLSPPTAEGVEGKRRFERERLSRWFRA